MRKDLEGKTCALKTTDLERALVCQALLEKEGISSIIWDMRTEIPRYPHAPLWLMVPQEKEQQAKDLIESLESYEMTGYECAKCEGSVDFRDQVCRHCGVTLTW